MPVIDLTRYIVDSAGTWTNPSKDENLFGFSAADTMSPERLLLRWAGDFVALTGPLRVRVTVQAENMTVPLALVGNLAPAATASPPTTEKSPESPIKFHVGVRKELALDHMVKGRALGLQASTIYSYTLDVAAGQAWPFSLSEQLDTLRLRNLRPSNLEQLGNNLGFRVLIEPAFTIPTCPPATSASDLPCDFAVADRPNTASFFPVACEPCNGTVIGLPPACTVALVTPAAEGGCVRTRFFNGMFITREDLETEQRYHRLKSKLHNRAAGAGVVWGLNVGKQGSYVCVMPGYGVDCCGNDLALTTTYKVEIAALLADPAAATLVHQRGPQRMHLLLEYVECPSDPRPVHGDPCAPEVSRCEMSRIRESVRLRLVPPRDYSAAKESAPIQRFLDDIGAMRGEAPPTPAPAPPPVATGTDQVPFKLKFTVTYPNAPTKSADIQPSPGSGPTDVATLKGLLEGAAAGDVIEMRSLKIEVVPDLNWSFVAGTLSAQALQPGDIPVGGLVLLSNPNLSGIGSFSPIPSATLSSPPIPPPSPMPKRFEFKIVNWSAQPAPATRVVPALGGDVEFSLELNDLGDRSYFVTNPSLRSVIRSRPLDLAPEPCGGEPCGGWQRGGSAEPCSDFIRGTKAPHGDPTPVLPWLHADPNDPSSAGDPKALLLAALGSWLSQRLVRERVGTSTEITTELRATAEAIYRTAWRFLFGVGRGENAAKLGDTLKRLLEAWCCGSLWKGPECCGDPHGVVIGCAVVEGGTIQGIDPFGGRRYVIHYPLIEHWGAQFGIAPLDVIASRFFSTLCCLSGLPVPSPSQPGTPVARVPVGGGLLVFGDSDQVRSIPEMQSTPVRTVGRVDFMARVVRALGTDASAVSGTMPQLRFTAVELAGLDAKTAVLLLLPA